MFNNYLKIAFRNILWYKAYSFINIAGLAVGIACFAIIMLYIHDELSYDKFHKDFNRIYRVAVEHSASDGSKSAMVRAPSALIPAMLHNIPEVEKGTHFCPIPSWGKAKLSNPNATYYDDKMLYVDSTFFDIFSFSFVQGDAKSALTNPSSVVITENLARRFFGDENAVGEILLFSRNKTRNEPLLVSAVIEDVPSQSHFTFDFLVPMYSFVKFEDTWVNGFVLHSYFKTSPGISLPEIEAKIQQLADANVPDNTSTYSIQPLAGLGGIHLSSNLLEELQQNSDPIYMVILLLVAVFVILIGGINYINLATARSTLRGKEVGVRKTVGALRKSLMTQFLSESILMSISAGIVAFGLTEFALLFFNKVMHKQLSLFAATSQPVWMLAVAVVLGIGLIGGMYPAVFLSSFRPVSALKNRQVAAGKGFGLRQVLVGFQFGMTTLLMVGIITVQQQMSFIRNVDLGFNAEQVILIKSNIAHRDTNYVMRDALKKVPGVINVGSNRQRIGLMDQRDMISVNLKGSENKQPIMWRSYIDHNYLDVVGIELKEGRNFSPELDEAGHGFLSNSCILNETAVRHLGVSEPCIIGQQLITDSGRAFTVVGVVKDFHAASLHDDILPLGFVFSRAIDQYLAVKIAGGDIRETLARIEETWIRFQPDFPMDFQFLDSAIEHQYRSERNFSAVLSAMTGLSVMIACLGLFGLVSFTAGQRTKEIGIRKVLGASVTNVIALLSKDFVKLVVIANIVVWPVAYYLMNRWLEDFAYRIKVSWWIFALAGGLALLIALLTVSMKAIRAAIANPVESLKYE